MKQNSLFEINVVRALEVFAAVVETRHVTQAAAMLGITQSAASQHLRNLEEALGTKLIDRSSRPVDLTKAGIALHRRAVAVLSELEALRSDVWRANEAPLPALRIALLASIATTLTPGLTVLMRDRFKIPEISLYAGIASEHQTLLRNRRIDLAITSDVLFDFEGFDWHPVLTERFLLVTPKGWPGDTGDLEALGRDLPLIRLARDTPVGMRTDQHLNRVRLQLPRAVECDRTSMVLAIVAAGRGFALLTPTLLIDGLIEGMAIDTHKLPIPGFSRQIVLVCREGEFNEMPSVFAANSAAILGSAIGRLLPDISPDAWRVDAE